MSDQIQLELIRENERKSHIAMYSNTALYEKDSWLRKPIRTVVELLPYFEGRTDFRILDLGCGVGRNCIAIALHFQNISCRIDCVDILDLAIEKLSDNAQEFGVSRNIYGIVSTIEEYPIPQNHYDWIIAVSALEHVDSKETFVRKLEEIKHGIRQGGIVCLVINSDVKEIDKSTKYSVCAQLEVNYQTDELLSLLNQVFSGWEFIKQAVREQRYDIPRENRVHEMVTNVVTLSARNKRP